MKYRNTVFICLLLSLKGIAQDSIVYSMANTPVFTTNLFRVPAVDKDGIIYMGSPRQGMYRYSNGIWTKMSILSDHQINDIRIDEFNKVWIAQSGQGGAQSATGGLNSFDDSLVANFTYYGNLAPSSIPTNNTRAVYVGNTPKVWTTHLATSLTGSVSSLGLGVNFLSPYFSKITSGINSASMDCIAGNDAEVWAAANNNIVSTVSTGQILRFNATTGASLGFYDYTNIPGFLFGPSSYVRSLLFARDGRQWIGMTNGEGLIIKSGNDWKSFRKYPFITASTTVNNNSLFESSNGWVYVGTTTGLLVYKGGDLDKEENWLLYTTANGLPNNNVTGIAEDKRNGTIVVTTSGGVAVWKNKKIAELRWDKSYLTVTDKPFGLAADGVSRVYIRVFSGPGLPSISKARVKIIQTPGQPRSMQGKLKIATEWIRYSEEANNAQALDVSDEIYPGKSDYYFWYVSPDDFCSAAGNKEADSTIRTEYVKVYVDYSNGSKDSADMQIKIVRPPLVLVHGLASGPAAWNKLGPNSSIPFISNPLFMEKKALKMNGQGAFKENALTLMEYLNSNSISTSIAALHDKGFACNQVDYVCHSMGGLMLRTAVEFYPELYYNSTPYVTSNYGKGFVHKLITINSPHNGSPVADMVTDYAPQLPSIVNSILGTIYTVKPSMQQPFDFVTPQFKSGLLPVVSPFKATQAVRNLQTRIATGGYNLKETRIRNHIITGDVDWTNPNIAVAILAYDGLIEKLSNFIGVARNLATTPEDKSFLTSLQGLPQINAVWSFVEWYSTKMGYPNFLSDGDLVVPLVSQLARQNPAQSHITNYKNSSNSVVDANHVDIVERSDVGQRVLTLLNSAIASNLFADAIPANTDPEPPVQNGMQLYAPLPIVTQYGTSKVQITSPASNAGDVYADSTLNITISLKDTQGFAYMKVFFQDKDSSTISTNASQTFSFKISPEFPDSQAIVVMAVYDKPTQIEYHIDTAIKIVKNKAVATGIQFKDDSLQITAGIPEFPALQIQYSGKWVALPANAAGLVLSSKDSSIMTFDQNKALKGVAPGSTKLYASYLGFKDTVGVNCSPALLSSSVIKSMGSGKFSSGTTWNRSGGIPTILDSVVIKAGHIVTLDTFIRVRAIYVEPGGNLQFKGKAGDSLKIGEYNFKDGLGFIYPPVWKSSHFDLHKSRSFNDVPSIARYCKSQIGKQTGYKREKIRLENLHNAYQDLKCLPKLYDFKDFNRSLINNKSSC